MRLSVVAGGILQLVLPFVDPRISKGASSVKHALSVRILLAMALAACAHRLKVRRSYSANYAFLQLSQ